MASISEILELTQLDDLIESMVLNRAIRDDEEIRQYAVKAKQLMETWEESQLKKKQWITFV
ncbi:MAG: hypothetical protein ACXAEU_15870 [Candidatus Hodarchaeales archaeon]